MLYKLVFRKFSFKELWLLSNKNPLQFLISCLVKILGGSIPCCPDIFNVESIAELRCGEEAIPQAAREAFLPIQQRLAALGFHSPVFYSLWDGYHLNRICRAEYAAPHGEGFARIHFRRWEKAQPAKTATYVVFTSIFADGSMLVSSSAKWSTGPANVILNVQPNADPEILWHSHLVKLPQVQRDIYQITTPEAVVWAGEKYHADFFNFYVQRGLFRPLNAAEQASEARDRGTYQELQSAGKQYPEVLIEIRKLQEQKAPKWTRLVVILGLSALVFIALGLGSWGRDYLYLLVPVLLLHEGGHYVTMKIFGYRNLKMFFIPLFGAAVSGRHYNVAGWKKVVVSLMGPAPGIYLGAMLGCVGLVLHHALLEKLSLLLLITNGFNLIPFIPLDGGWAFQAIIFSRHYFFDVSFKIVAALAMLGLSFLLKTRTLMYVRIATLTSLPVAINVAKVTSKLRSQGFVAASPDDQNIPDAVAETIISELKGTMPKLGTAKNLAQMTLQVFENLNARPPGWAASIGLLAWYGGTVLIAVVFAAIVILGQNGTFRDLLANAVTMPRMKYECHSVKSIRHGESNGSPLNLVVTLDKPAKAEEAFAALAARLGEQESLEKIGQTLVLSIPDSDRKARQDWLDRLEAYSTNAFVDWTNNSASFSFFAIASNAAAASNLVEELKEFFYSPQQAWYLVPPWAPNDPRSAGQQAADRKARRTYRAVVSGGLLNFTAPELRALQKKMADTRRHGDAEQLQALTQQFEETTKQMRKDAIVKLRGDLAMDPSIIDLYQKYEDLPYTNKTRLEILVQITKQMGVAADKSHPLTGAGLYAARSGSASSNGLMIRIYYVSFADTFEGAPALLDWLCAQGCQGIRYSVTSTPYYASGDEDIDDQ